MTKKNLKILAIETSCDETAAAVISENRNKPEILSNIVSSQIDLHAKTGGVVPEVASRAHMEAILPVVSEALVQAKLKNPEKLRTTDYNLQTGLSDITHIAVTAGPGLIGSLLVGFNTAKSLAYSLDLPIIPINHIEGHVYSAFAEQFPIPNFQFPILALTVSGGHSSLTLMKDHGIYENLGQTLDDAAGEAFDKVAKLLDLGYPGGPVVSKLADELRNKVKNQRSPVSAEARSEVGKIKNNKEKNSNLTMKQFNNEIVFPRPILNDGTFNFSFSGLKTAVLTEVVKLRTKDYELPTSEICAAFEDSLTDVLTTKTMRAIDKFKPKGLILAGGVAANSYLQAELQRKVNEYNQTLKKRDQINFYMPPRDMTGDNAAMIGLAAYYHISRGDVKGWDEIEVDSNFKL
ncbi:MAG: tRNA (adenosine(37)-N6)-threonylcarbamoyltransferase complex transferase subunit TsaD [Patescibacteria group bacterium]